MPRSNDNQFFNRHLKQRRTKKLPQSQRSLEEVVVARRQASELISEYEQVSDADHPKHNPNLNPTLHRRPPHTPPTNESLS